LKASWFYKIAAVLLLLFSVGHTLGFRQSDPQWKVDALVADMQKIHFNAQGFDRSYWDFFVGFGLFVSVFLLFAAILAWQLSGMKAEILAMIPAVKWSLALCFIGITILSWKYFFVVPVVFSSVITLCLIVAAWLPSKT
jgi:hypothetical protein